MLHVRRKHAWVQEHLAEILSWLGIDETSARHVDPVWRIESWVITEPPLLSRYIQQQQVGVIPLQLLLRALGH